MSDLKLPEGAPEEVITAAHVREIDLAPFGHTGTLSLITLDNGMDHNRPNTFGPQSLSTLNDAITIAEQSSSIAIAITGKPFIFAAGADLSGIAFMSDMKQAQAIGKLGHDVFRRFGEGPKPTFAFVNGLALGGGLEVALHCKYRINLFYWTSRSFLRFSSRLGRSNNSAKASWAKKCGSSNYFECFKQQHNDESERCIGTWCCRRSI